MKTINRIAYFLGDYVNFFMIYLIFFATSLMIIFYIVWQDKKAHDFSRGLNCLIKPHVLSATFALTFSFGLQCTF